MIVIFFKKEGSLGFYENHCSVLCVSLNATISYHHTSDLRNTYLTFLIRSNILSGAHLVISNIFLQGMKRFEQINKYVRYLSNIFHSLQVYVTSY